MTEISTQTEWGRSQTEFYPGNRADKFPVLPGGIYRFVKPQIGPWFLDRTANKFEFPFKIYDSSEHIIQRITKFWEANGGNLGVLLNGLRGAGKTMAAQLLTNRLIADKNLPCLVVRDPIPLQLIFDAVQQDMIVIFDEFEKTHDEDNHPGAQQALLSTIDGTSRSSHKRLILFTTNNTRMDENFKDRPSRIHYKFEFKAVSDEIIEGLINDSLPEDLMHLKQEIFQFLHTRDILTIDIVKAVIAEVKTFRESPLAFEDMLNIAKGTPPAFTIRIVDPETMIPLSTLSSFFRPCASYGHQRWAPLLSGNKHSVDEFIANGNKIEIYSQSWDGGCGISLLEKCEENGFWLAEVKVPRKKTPYADFSFLEDEMFYLDTRPREWRLPSSPKAAAANEKLQDEVETQYYAAVSVGTVYGTGKRAVFKVQIEANHDTYKPDYQVTGAGLFKAGGMSWD